MENRSSLVIAFLMGVILTLGFALLNQNTYLPRAYADGGSGGEGIFMVTNNGTSQQGKDMLFIVQKGEDGGKRLAIYEYAGGRLELGAVRNIDYDLRFESWSKKGQQQKPSVKEQKKNSEKKDSDKKSRR